MAQLSKLRSASRNLHHIFGVQTEALCLTTERMTITRNIGMLLLAIYLICVGLVGLGVMLGLVPAIIALVAGIFILLGR